MTTIDERLAELRAAKNLRTKGKLAAMLHASRLAIEHGLPIDANELVTDGRGQVKGLGKGRVQSILADHGVTRTLAEEAGRTSRGNLGDTIEYVEFLNELNRERPLSSVELASIETWWVERVLDFFASKPFSLKYDASKSMRAIVRTCWIRPSNDSQRTPALNTLER